MMAAMSVDQLPFDSDQLRGTLKINEPMSRHTSWRVGGPAEYFYLPADREDTVTLLKTIPQSMSVYWLGLGSNMLVKDSGVKGIVIKTTKALTQLKVLPNNQLYAEAGVSCAKIARHSVADNLTGAEFLAGVPGSFGGALAMNAGAFGGETWPLVIDVECIDRQGNVETYSAEQIQFSYREVVLPQNKALLAGRLQLNSANTQGGGRVEIKSLLEKRSASQPIQSANAGSVFKNPPGNFAAKIIEQLGLKGYQKGGARYSEVHANFIINDGTASASDIEFLINLVKDRATNELGVVLEPEVRVLGGGAHV